MCTIYQWASWIPRLLNPIISCLLQFYGPCAHICGLSNFDLHSSHFNFHRHGYLSLRPCSSSSICPPATTPPPPSLPPSPLPLSWRRKSYVEHLLTHPLSFQEQGNYEVGVCSSFLWVHLILSVGTRVGKLRCPVLLVSFPSTRFVLYIVQCMTVVHRSPFFYLSSFISACLLFILCKTGKDNLPHGSGWMKWVNVYRVSEMERGTWEFPHQCVFFVVVGT